MVRSMTGFATQSVTLILDDGSSIGATINIKSLNSRFFEANCRLPHPLASLETDLIKELKKKLLRGYVQCTIHVSDIGIFKGAVAPALNTVSSYLDAIKQIQKKTNISGALELKDIIDLPNVFTAQEQKISKKSIQHILQTVDIVIEQLITEQEKEGAMLATDLRERIKIINKEMAAIEQEALVLMDKKKKLVDAELQTLESDENKLMEIGKSAVYVILDKIDIHEEITRFKSHIENFEQQLTGKKIEKGKRLDFTLQELAREINTITAKCSDAGISTRAINIKVELEKAREQTQNIV